MNSLTLKSVSLCLFGFAPAIILSQTSMLAEFKAMPALPVGAKEAFKASQVNYSSDMYFYKDYSLPVASYIKKIEADNKPYQDIITAKGKAGMAPGMGAANDFSDLNSPETQAKLAKMTQEEKIKFAMEIQQRMQSNKNLQAVSAQTKPSPLINIILKLNQSSQALLAVMPDFIRSPDATYGKCANLCPVDNDPTCEARINACYHKISSEYFNSEITRFNTLIKNAQSQYLLKKGAFENDLKEFDTQAAKCSKDDIAVDCSNALTMILAVATRIATYEKEGATLLVEAKNTTYCKNDF